uniref:Uncharacterized protein n=1 Tax=Leersia perrieri TaxID=77586 RepID=A0A0D9W940_9ORYZ
MPKRPSSDSRHHGSSRSSKRLSFSSSSSSSERTEEHPSSSSSSRHVSRRTDKRPSSSGRRHHDKGRMEERRHSSPARRHGSGRTAVNRHENPPPPPPAPRRRKRHLYLVMDDWEEGYGIYKVDVDTFDPDAEFDSDSEAECEARPRRQASPLVRVETPINFSRHVTAHGSKILAMLPSPGDAMPGIPTFDAVTRAMTVCPWPENVGTRFQPFCMSVGDRLFRLCNPWFHVLGPQPSPPRSGQRAEPWSWTEISNHNKRSMPPFASDRVSAYTVWVSVENPVVDNERDEGYVGDRNSTFAFDTERLEWTLVGEWLMPFEGQAHYVGELDAWVGLSRVHREHLCCCPNDGDGPWGEGPFTSRVGPEVMFRAESVCRPAAKLLYMGKSRFCMVESNVHKDVEDVERSRREYWENFPRWAPRDGKGVEVRRTTAIRMTTFRV